MPRDEDAGDRRMTRQIFAALMMSSLCSGTGGRGIADQRLDLLAGDAVSATDALLAKLEQEEHAERKVYQARRLRFEAVFLSELTLDPASRFDALSVDHIVAAWKKACKTVEPEFFPELRT